MKKNILKYFILIISFLSILVIYLSTIGIETDSFNNQIKKKIIEKNKNLNLDLKKIKLILDPFNLQINAKTVGATLFYLNRPLPLEYIKTKVSIRSIINNKIISSNVEIASRSMLLTDLIKFLRATNNKTELFILEKTIKKGHIIIDLSLNFDETGTIKNDYEIKGLIKDANISFFNKSKLENLNFNFILSQNLYKFNDIKFKFEKVKFISDKLQIQKKNESFLLNGTVKNNQSKINENIVKLLNLNSENLILEDVNFTSKTKFSFEVNKQFDAKNFFLNSDISVDEFKYKKPDIIDNYLSDINDVILFKNHKFKLNYSEKNLSIKGEGEAELGNGTNQIKYLIKKKDRDFNVKSELIVNNINLKRKDYFKIFFPQIRNKINFKSQMLKINYNNKDLSFSGTGKIKIEKDFEEVNYYFEKKANKINFNTELNLNKTNFKIDNINYKKKKGTNLRLKIKGELSDKQYLNINHFIADEENNKIKILNLSLDDENQIIEIEKADLNYLDTDGINNNYQIKKVKKNNYIINGIFFNAKSLITNLLESDRKKEENIFKNNLIVELYLKKVYIDNINFVKELKGTLKIKKNKILDANILASFNDKQIITFTINTNKQGEKITTLFSSKAKPLVDRYKFIKGFEDSRDGYLDFHSSKINGISTSKLVIDNFKVKKIPALAKLLALASLQGIADLLTGEGIRFTDFEMNFTTENKTMKIQELYAIGPAITILLDGYLEGNNLVSLRGTLVPATTINRSIASIPLIGDLLIGKKVGEGVFGVSFKIKGPPKNLETTVNPIKTLTPRFITRTLEKIKKN